MGAVGHIENLLEGPQRDLHHKAVETDVAAGKDPHHPEDGGGHGAVLAIAQQGDLVTDIQFQVLRQGLADDRLVAIVGAEEVSLLDHVGDPGDLVFILHLDPQDLGAVTALLGRDQGIAGGAHAHGMVAAAVTQALRQCGTVANDRFHQRVILIALLLDLGMANKQAQAQVHHAVEGAVLYRGGKDKQKAGEGDPPQSQGGTALITPDVAPGQGGERAMWVCHHISPSGFLLLSIERTP